MKLQRIVLLAAAAALFAACPGSKEVTEVRVMTYNLAVGIDLDAIFAQPSLLDVMKQAEVAWHQKDQSDFAKRAKLVAAAINAQRPDLVGLQEVAKFFSGPALDPAPAATPAQDFRVLLLQELAALGLDYAVVTDGTTEGEVTNADVEVTGASSIGVPTADYRIVDRELVLARPTVTVTAVRKGNFTAHIDVPIPGVSTPIPYKRGWVAVDATKAGKAFTFLSTHLDAFDPRVQGAQAHELLALLPAGRPAIVVGDMNAQPGETAWPSYGILVSSTTGLADTVADVGATVPTCCFDALCSDPNATLARRVDHVLHTAHFESQSAALVGGAGSYSSADHLWPADHAGVEASVGLE